MTFLSPKTDAIHWFPPWSDVQPTLKDDEVGAIYREPFIVNHYRRSDQPWRYYIHSLFHIHNETFNVWSHLLSFFLFIYKVHECSLQVDLFSHPQGCAVLGFAFGTLSYAVLSTLAHLLHSKSELVHMTVFQLDYIGIGLNTMGSGLVTYYFAGTGRFYELASPFFVQVNFIFAFISCVSCGIAILLPLRPYRFHLAEGVLKMGSVGIHVVYIISPLAFRGYYDCLQEQTSTTCPDGHMSRHLHYAIAFFAATFFYASKFPERLSPGTFDAIGYGHGAFHVLMTVTSLLQYDAALYEIKHTPPQLLDQMTAGQSNSCAVIWTGLVALVAADVAFVIMTHRIRVNKQQDICKSQS